MSFFERLKLENEQIEKFEYFQNTCFSCKYWVHKIKKDSKFCHKCINNLEIPIKQKEQGYCLDGLRDYYTPVNRKKKKNTNILPHQAEQ